MLSDEFLMEQAKLGNRDAYTELITKYRKQVICFAYSIVKDFNYAEDIAQECFIKLYIKREQYQSTQRFKPYLFTILRNICIDFLRYNKKSVHWIELDMQENYIVSKELVPELWLDQQEKWMTIQQYFTHLSPIQQQSLYLYAFENQSYAEIAQILHKTQAQIKISIYRARKKMKQLQEKEHEKDEI